MKSVLCNAVYSEPDLWHFPGKFCSKNQPLCQCSSDTSSQKHFSGVTISTKRYSCMGGSSKSTVYAKTSISSSLKDVAVVRCQRDAGLRFTIAHPQHARYGYMLYRAQLQRNNLWDATVLIMEMKKGCGGSTKSIPGTYESIGDTYNCCWDKITIRTILMQGGGG